MAIVKDEEEQKGQGTSQVLGQGMAQPGQQPSQPQPQQAQEGSSTPSMIGGADRLLKPLLKHQPPPSSKKLARELLPILKLIFKQLKAEASREWLRPQLSRFKDLELVLRKGFSKPRKRLKRECKQEA